MINTQALPIESSGGAIPDIVIDQRTALMFNGLGIVAVALAGLLPVALAGYWLTADPATLAQSLRLPDGAFGDLSPTTRMIALALTLPAIVPLVWALVRLRVCFGEFGQGRPFAARGIAGLRDFAVGIGLSALGKPISTTLLTPYLSWGAPAGKRQIVFTLDSDVLMLALFAAIIASLAWAMRKAAAIAEENSQFI